MPEITGVRYRKGRVRVFVDGEFWAEIDDGVAAERGVREGAEFPEENLDEIRVSGERPLAMTRAFNLLGYRARSEAEIRDRLSRAGYAPGTVDTVLSRLGELGYLDDAEYARNLAREKSRKYGPRRVYVDLRKNGVDESIIQEVLEEEFSESSEREAAFAAASRRYNTGEGSDAQSRRVYGFLARRGYSADVCAEVAREHRGT
ncbi:MAG: regulatory protein RecX [Rubrobacteraceae bacterium]